MSTTKDILFGVVRGQLPLSEVTVGLSGDCEQVEILPSDIEPKLELYLVDGISAECLQTWASWILSRQEFCSASRPDDDYFEPMWYLLQKISTPFIDGEITKLGICEYLKMLRSLY